MRPKDWTALRMRLLDYRRAGTAIDERRKAEQAVRQWVDDYVAREAQNWALRPPKAGQ